MATSLGTTSSTSYTNKMTGSNANMGLSTTQGAQTILRNPLAVKVNGTVPQGQLKKAEVVPNTSSPATTPLKGFDTATATTDAYRNGGFSGGTSDNLLNPRTLGEVSTNDDVVASINITSVMGQGDVVTGYSRFFLQGINEARSEKYQVVETFTAYYTFFFGERPSVYSFRGTLLNDENFRWTNDMLYFYENVFRGTRAVELGCEAVINYDTSIVHGYILNMNVQKNADLNKGASFGIDMLVTSHTISSQAALIAQQISTINRTIPTLNALQAAHVLNGKALPNLLTTEIGLTSLGSTSLKGK